MLRYLYGDELDNYPGLRDSMFEDRATQFHTRLGWQVGVDARGQERDEYDAMNPIYVIWQDRDGRHGGSMRFLPTTGRTMTRDHFSDLTDGVTIISPLIWEVTRFCLAPGLGAQTGAHVAAALMLGGAEVGQGFHLSHALGVYDARMVRVYRRLGWGPTILGARGAGPGAVSVGLWEFSRAIREKLLHRAGISRQISAAWFGQAFEQRGVFDKKHPRAAHAAF